jgi:hypothetical protein
MIKHLAVVSLFGLITCATPAAELKAVRIASRIDVTIGTEFFTSYRFSDDEKYPFFFPVNGRSGASVTSIRNGRYPHHSSLFFGCDKVNGGNYWQDGLERGRIISEGAVIAHASGAEIVITDACVWKRAGAAPPMRDRRRIVISAPAPAVRQIDFEITLEPLMDVTIEKTNHSLFSVRMDPDLTPDMGGTMINAAGATSEQGTFGLRSPWMACYGKRGAEAIEGLAIFQHPSSRWAPAPWFTRDYGFMSPTPMYWPAEGSITRLRPGETVVLRYRVLVFSGDPEHVDLPGRYSAYAAETRK